MASHLKKNKLPIESDIVVQGFFREMTKKDLAAVHKLVKTHLSNFKLHPHLS